MTPEQEIFYHKLITDYYTSIYRYVMGMVCDVRQAEELAVDTFHEAVEQIEQLMEHEAPKLWLFRTAKNKTMNYSAHRVREAKRSISIDSETLSELSAGEGDIIDASTLLTAIEQVLSPDDYRLFVLHSQGLPSHALAEQFGCTESACRKRMQRIREKLRKELF